ncbi:MAG: GAF domain-containing protein, partial [Methylicorpusculum sp.]|nr:GAF domain-containing protein [Methylicorpusculum sp.]
MEGIQRGLGMDRALFALLAQDKKSMKEKLSLGWRKEYYDQKIIFSISQSPLNIFSQALRNPQGLMVSGASDGVLFTDADKRVIGQHDCFLMPVCSGEQPIGLIYSDRSFSQQPFTDDDFNGFKHFVQQANIGLAMYRMQGKK